MDLENMLDNLSKRVPTDGETYTGPDGLLYCKRCETARQCRVEAFGKLRTVNCLCKCMGEARDREEEERKQRERMLEVQRYRSMGFPDREMMACTFDTDDGSTPKLTEAMKAYVDNFPAFRKNGKGLLLYGNVGTGKSFYAACIVNALIDRGHPCLMTNFSRMINLATEKWEGRQDYIDSLSKFTLIAIDDLGVERDREFTNEQVAIIIDSLYRAKVPLIITSNFTPKQLTEETDMRRARAYDRLIGSCHPVKVDGPSRRKDKGRNEFKAMNDLLGL